MTTIWELVCRAATDRPNDIILADDHGRSLSVAEFRMRAEQVAAALHERGVHPGSVVSWQLPTTLEAAVLFAACSRIGAVQNPIIPTFRSREVGLIAAQIDPALVVVPARWNGFEHEAMARDLGLEVLAIDLEDHPDGPLRLPIGSADVLSEPPGDPGPRWVYYSSGTTSDPKGARHSDTTLIAGSNGLLDGLGLDAADVHAVAFPISHIGGAVWLVGLLRRGGSAVLISSWNPEETPRRIAEFEPTLLGSAPPFLVAYADAARDFGPRRLFPRLRACLSGGTTLPDAVRRHVATTLGVPTVSGWGLTEFPNATFDSPSDPGGEMTVGRPTRGVRVRVVEGELRLKGPQCFLGYVDERSNVDAFDEEGWFRTGDLGSIDPDGRVQVVGRSKDVIIRNAENISAREVEEVLLEHPGVAEAAVVGIPHPRTGEQACAFLVTRQGVSLTLGDIVGHCLEHGLAKFKCPERLELADHLPRDGMGKVRKRELLERIEFDGGGTGNSPPE